MAVGDINHNHAWLLLLVVDVEQGHLARYVCQQHLSFNMEEGPKLKDIRDHMPFSTRTTWKTVLDSYLLAPEGAEAKNGSAIASSSPILPTFGLGSCWC